MPLAEQKFSPWS